MFSSNVFLLFEAKIWHALFEHSTFIDFHGRELTCSFLQQQHLTVVQTLSVGSPRKVERSRSCSPVPGHRGFSFGKEALGRIEVVSPNGATSSSGAATAAAIGGAGAGVGSPNATMNSASR